MTDTPRVNALESNPLDSFDFRAWKTLARELERELIWASGEKAKLTEIVAARPEETPTKQPPTILEINSEARSTCQEFELDSEGDLCVSHKDKCDQGAEINFWLLKDDVQHLRDWLNRHAAFSPQRTTAEEQEARSRGAQKGKDV